MAAKPQLITVPYCPRPQQRTIHDALDSHRFGAVVCHRRFGKTVLSLNQLQKGALTCLKPRPRFAYIAPTYRQGKATGWDYLKHYSRVIPGVQANETELRVDYPNGGQVRIFGADNPDSLRGLYFDGAVLDEYGMMPPTVFTEVVRPALADRQGWALFLGTPAGKNQFYDVVQIAKSGDPSWFFAEHRASATHILPAEELDAARRVMTADEYAQEFECSFEASVKGSIFGAELTAAREQNRICRVPYDPVIPVNTAWDLGVGDATAIWFYQPVWGGEVRIIDYYEASGEGLPHYASVLQGKGYVYGTHYAPHDIEVRELGSGKSRKEIGASLGMHFQTAPKLTVEDGIHACRMLLPRCYFDAEKCAPGIEALQHYRRDYNTRLNEFKATPVHDWASHGADAFRTLAVAYQVPKRKSEVAALRQQQRDVDPYDRRVIAGHVRHRGGY